MLRKLEGIWLLFICPAMGWYTIWSPLLLVIPLFLLRFDDWQLTP